MIPVLSGAEMRAADRRTIDEIGLPGAVLMENAGGAVARVVRERFVGAQRVVIICGKGNNGGDGFVVGQHLGGQAQVFLVGRRQELTGDAARHAAALERGVWRIHEVGDDAGWAALRAALAGADLIVDALLGTGLREAASGPAALAIAAIVHARRERGTAVVSVDIPSGVSSDDGNLRGPVVSADVTVTFASPKWGHALPPACNHSGELFIADIGIPESVLRQVGAALFILEPTDAAAAFAVREPGAHKGTYGHVLVVAGSLGKSGAAVLAATGALRTGAGLVTAAVPAAILPMVATARAEVMTEPLPTPLDCVGPECVERALALAESRDAVVLGPGLGQGTNVREFVTRFLRECSRPVVVDADALNALAGEVSPTLPRRGATVLTPHPGEMSRLLGVSGQEVQARRVDAARQLASASGAVVVLKGQRTLVAEPSGRVAVNPTGNPGMATAGSGDVLAGVVGALLAGGHDAWLSAAAAVFVHGRAGDRAAAARGQEAMLASDLADDLGPAITSVQRGEAQPGITRL